MNTPEIDNLRELLQRMCDGKDATTLPAHSEYTVLQLVAEVGTDLTRWPTEKHFASWLGLAPGSAQSGKRRAAVKRRRNRAGQIFCVMARALARSKYIALGGYYRRMAARRGGLVANKALAHKLAILFWRVMVKGMDYVEQVSPTMRPRSSKPGNASSAGSPNSSASNSSQSRLTAFHERV